jgi:hypothetical protein
MADYGYTDTQWERIAERELGSTIAAPLRVLREIEDRFRKSRTQLWGWTVPSAQLKTSHAAPVTLAGVDVGTNTDDDGTLYVRVTGSGPYTVTLYKTTGGGGGDAVASGSANADAEVTLTASNSSGLTGTWQLPASVTTSTDDSLRLRVCEDFRVRLPDVYTADGTVEDDPYSRNALEDAYDQVAAAIASAKAAIRAGARRWGLSDGQANPTARLNDFLQAGETSLAGSRVVTDTSGNVSVRRTGAFERLSQGMADETTGSTQYVVKRAMSAGAGSFASSNDGAGAVASHTPLERTPACRLTMRCVRGVDSGDLGAEAFDGFIYLDDGRDSRVAASGLRVGKQWSHPIGIGPITLTRTLSKTNDGSNNVFAAASGCTVTGENNANTDEGVLYVKTEANGSNWDISFYSSSTQSDASLVSKATNVAASTAFTTSAQNGSGLVISWTTGGTVSAVTNITLDLQPFLVQNSNNVPDEFTVTVTASSEGRFQTIMAEEFGAQLNSTTSGSETITDESCGAGTFFEFLIADN